MGLVDSVNPSLMVALWDLKIYRLFDQKEYFCLLLVQLKSSEGLLICVSSHNPLK